MAPVIRVMLYRIDALMQMYNVRLFSFNVSDLDRALRMDAGVERLLLQLNGYTLLPSSTLEMLVDNPDQALIVAQEERAHRRSLLTRLVKTIIPKRGGSDPDSSVTSRRSSGTYSSHRVPGPRSVTDLSLDATSYSSSAVSGSQRSLEFSDVARQLTSIPRSPAPSPSPWRAVDDDRQTSSIIPTSLSRTTISPASSGTRTSSAMQKLEMGNLEAGDTADVGHAMTGMEALATDRRLHRTRLVGSFPVGAKVIVQAGRTEDDFPIVSSRQLVTILERRDGRIRLSNAAELHDVLDADGWLSERNIVDMRAA